MPTHPAIDAELYADRLDFRLSAARIRRQVAHLIAEAVAAAGGRVIESRPCGNPKCQVILRVGSLRTGCYTKRRLHCSDACRNAAFKARHAKRRRKRGGEGGRPSRPAGKR